MPRSDVRLPCISLVQLVSRFPPIAVTRKSLRRASVHDGSESPLPHQATFAWPTIRRSRSSWAWLLRQMMCLLSVASVIGAVQREVV